jgi:uncharacterized protein
MAACQGGHPQVIRQLIDAGADIESQGEYQQTPLFYAALRGDLYCVKLLIEAGADVNHINEVSIVSE